MKKWCYLSTVMLGALFLTSDAFAASAVLSWNANSENDLAGYKLYYGTSARTTTCPAQGGYAGVLDVGNVNTYTFNSLIGGMTYYFAVTAYDTSTNESCYSTEASKLVLDDGTVPYVTINGTTSSLSAKASFKNNSRILPLRGKKLDAASGKVVIYRKDGRTKKKIKTIVIDATGYWTGSINLKSYKKYYTYLYLYYNSQGSKIYSQSKKVRVLKKQ